MNSTQLKKKKKIKLLTGNQILVLIMMLPALLYLLFNNYLPLYGITIAFKEIDFSLDNIFASPYNHFENFKYLFESDEIWIYVKNTVLYNIVFLAINLTIPVAMAVLFTQIKKLKKIYQTLILLPYLMSWVIVSYIGFALFNGENGMLNSLIIRLGGSRINFYSRDAVKAWPFILVFFNTWRGVGFTFLFYYSACLGISPSLYEAAKLDGANFWQQVIHVTLPGIKSIMITMFIMGLAGIVRSDYGLFYLVTKNSGQLYDVTQTIDTFIFNALKGNGDITLSSAASVLQSIVGFILIMISNVVLRKISPDNALF